MACGERRAESGAPCCRPLRSLSPAQLLFALSLSLTLYLSLCLCAAGSQKYRGSLSTELCLLLPARSALPLPLPDHSRTLLAQAQRSLFPQLIVTVALAKSGKCSRPSPPAARGRAGCTCRCTLENKWP